MPRINADQERERTEIVFRAVQMNPGLKESELAMHLNMERRTLHNYLTELEYRGRLQKDGPRWYVSEMFKERKLNPIQLEAEQAMSLYIAARALARVQDERNETAESALLTLSRALIGDFNVGGEISKAAADLAGRPERTGYNKVYRDLMRACVYRKQVRISYETAKGYRFDTDFEPYLFEPSLFGLSIYAIGYSTIAQAFRSYKLERIQQAELLRADFELRDSVPTLTSLKSAWSIMFGDEVETVELIFAPSVRKRVLETNWHPSQRVDSADPTLNAPLNWQVDVADATDMLPWVRGWGADVKVIRPEWMRNEIGEHVRAMSNAYGLVQSRAMGDVPAHHWLWAKASTSGNLHRLIYHMVDVGQCAQALWQRVLNTNTKQRIANWLGLSEDATGRLVAFWASLHDLGKASPAFQDHPNLRQKNPRLHRRIQDELVQLGLGFPQRSAGLPHARHEVVSTYALRSSPTHNMGEGLFARLSQLPDDLAVLVADMLGGHHGAFPTSGALSPTQLQLADKQNGKDDRQWAQARAQLFAEMQAIFQPPTVMKFEEDPARDNPVLMVLAGIVSAADWLGSDETTFPLTSEFVPITAYARQSAKLAELALRKVNWEPAPATPPLNFKRTFGFGRSAAQQQAHDALKHSALPALVIAEAPMGSGKTEMALEAVGHWLHTAGLSGAYIAMPTTATSNQMHERTTKFLQRLFGRDMEPMLVHSQALLRNAPDTPRDDETDSAAEEAEEVIEEQQHDGDRADAQAWFLPRKKSLLVPFGVGTVDQALMSVLQTKHFFVRLLGLSNKVVVFDEVHAYDAYMSVLFERLLVWLGQLGTSVVILSATLPNATRERFVRAYAGAKAIPNVRYPRLTVAPLHGEVNAIELAPPKSKTLAYTWIERDEQAIVSALRERLAHGGCAAVICNTISRAQKVYKAIQAAGLIDLAQEDEELVLFHARFPMAWREGIENDVLDRFGPNKADKRAPNPRRLRKAIVVATQVIEQSLDLDFDVMISDHAPIDLLLQRAGRLHRHEANEANRTHVYELLICTPCVSEGVPTFDRADRLVYDEFILLRSWLALQGRGQHQIQLPEDLSELIEQVYGNVLPQPDHPSLLKALSETEATSQRDEHKERYKARQRLVPQPDQNVLHAENLELDEDDPRVHQTFQALTRSDKPGINVVCLHRINGALHTDLKGESVVCDPSRRPNAATARELARHSVAIRRPDLEAVLLATPADEDAQRLLKRWKKVAALRHHRVLIFEEGQCDLPGTDYGFVLSNEFGLEIVKRRD